MSNIKFDNPEVTLQCQFRYALGKKNYIVRHTVDDIINNWSELGEDAKKRIKSEIITHKQLYGNIGMDIDEEEWEKVLKLPIGGEKNPEMPHSKKSKVPAYIDNSDENLTANGNCPICGEYYYKCVCSHDN